MSTEFCLLPLTGFCPVLFKLFFKFFPVQMLCLTSSNLFCRFIRQSVAFIQTECVLRAYIVHFFKFAKPAPHGRAEFFLFLFKYVPYALFVYFGIKSFVIILYYSEYILMFELFSFFFAVKDVGINHYSPHQSTQYVSGLLIARAHTVS